MNDKLFKKYRSKIARHELGESDVIALRSLLNREKDSHVTRFFTRLIANHPQPIGPEQTEKGITWLRDQWRTPLGKERKHNPFLPRQTYVLDNFSHFQLIGLRNTFGLSIVNNYLPVYRVHSKDGRHFDYVNTRPLVIL